MAKFGFVWCVCAALVAGELPLPPLWEGTRDGNNVSFELEAREGTHQFFASGPKEATLGYSGDYLGPVLRLRYGDRVRVAVRNSLSELTTLHWHGLLVPSAVDGDVRQTIQPGAERVVEFSVLNHASTLWFHPHALETVADQVYEGLSGLLYIDEPDNPAYADLPQTYGVDDVPLVLQDRRFDSNGKLRRRWDGMMTRIMGRLGNEVLFNGVGDAEYTVTSKLTRFRLLNASNDSVLVVGLSDGSPMQLIASDGGLLPKPLHVRTFTLPPSDRQEVVIDFSRYRPGDRVTLTVSSSGNRKFRGLELRVGEVVDRGTTVPENLNSSLLAGKTLPQKAPVQREVVLETSMHGRPGSGSTINGRAFDLHRVDWQIPAGAVEEWTVVNSRRGSRVSHTLHLHGTQFEVLSLNGREPPPELRGLHDNIGLLSGEEARIRIYFPQEKGQYLVHCHLLAHEEDGMMSWYEIV